MAVDDNSPCLAVLQAAVDAAEALDSPGSSRRFDFSILVSVLNVLCMNCVVCLCLSLSLTFSFLLSFSLVCLSSMCVAADVAARLDASDPLHDLHEEFHVPPTGDAAKIRSVGEPTVYLCGNSLGLQPKGARKAVEEEMAKVRRCASCMCLLHRAVAGASVLAIGLLFVLRVFLSLSPRHFPRAVGAVGCGRALHARNPAVGVHRRDGA